MLFKKLGVFMPLLLCAYNINTLSNSKYWHILGHYKNGVSEIDSKNFFLSKNGKYSPKEELKATIRRLTHPKAKDDNSVYCRFPARREWIKKEIPSLKIIPQNCKELKKELNAIKDVTSITLVFPTILMNSPASMFGHTLLRLDESNGDYLNSFAVNYAAYTDESNGLIYAYKGLTGGYIGKYAIVPYYKKISEYNDIKSRDIWEYKLNLDKKEINRLKLHLFEIKNTYSKYYYFNKNCSYEILWLLEAARPGLDIVYKFDYKVLPIDTIKEAKKEHLIVSSRFRPSKKRVILYYFNKIEHKTKALEFLKKDNFNIIKNLPTHEKEYILDFAIEMLNYKYLSKQIKRSIYLKNYISLLKKRSTLPKEKPLHITPPQNPINSHNSNKFWGYGKEGSILLGFKPAFHYTDDLNTGFSPGAYIDFFVTQIRINPDRLDYFYLFRINSLTKRDEIFKPVSWSVALGAKRFKNDRLYMFLTPSFGFTYSNLYAFKAGVEDYLREKNYFGGNIEFYTEKNFNNAKITFDIKRHFFDFKTYNSIKSMFILRMDKNTNLNIGYEKNINENYFFAGISFYL